MFKFLKKKNKCSIVKQSLQSMEDLWTISDKHEFMSAMYDRIDCKCSSGTNLEDLSDPERVIYINMLFEEEVNNGGFDQFFYNSSGDFYEEVMECLLEVGAEITASIYRQAMSALGRHIPKDRNERQELLDSLDQEILENKLNKCDDDFWDCEESLEELNYQFMMRHKQ